MSRSDRRAGLLGCAGAATAVLAAVFPVSVAAAPLPSSFTDQDFNVLVALEATANDFASLILLGGAAVLPQPLGTWTGTVSSTGWDLSFSGALNGTSLSLTQSGSLVSQTATWTDSGSYGAAGLSGSGMSAEDPSWLQTFLKIGAVIVVGGTQLASSVASGGTAAVFNVVASPITAGVLNKIIDDSTEVKPPTTPPPVAPKASLKSTSLILTNSNVEEFALLQTGTLDLTTGAVSFRSSVVPEPGGLGLLGVGLLGLGIVVRQRRG